MITIEKTNRKESWGFITNKQRKRNAGFQKIKQNLHEAKKSYDTTFTTFFLSNQVKSSPDSITEDIDASAWWEECCEYTEMKGIVSSHLCRQPTKVNLQTFMFIQKILYLFHFCLKEDFGELFIISSYTFLTQPRTSLYTLCLINTVSLGCFLPHPISIYPSNISKHVWTTINILISNPCIRILINVRC